MKHPNPDCDRHCKFMYGSKMKWYCYNEYDPDHPSADDTGGYIVTISEDEIKRTYWPYWYERMCKKFGKTEVDAKFCFKDCLEDWIIVNWAWESNNEH